MDTLSKEDGIITVMLLRLQRQRLPHLLALHKKVLSGDLLDDYDISFLDIVCGEAKNCHVFCKDHQEYNNLFSQIAHFYNVISTTALENQKRQNL